MIGRSGSPSSKPMITSWPRRGVWMMPQPWPAQSVLTRIQHEVGGLGGRPVRVELDLHPSVLVGEDLLRAGRADDDGRLRPLDAGLGRGAGGAEGQRQWDAGEPILVVQQDAVAGAVVVAEAAAVLHLGQDVGAV